MRRELLLLAETAGVVALSQWAFSLKSRNAIRDRDGHKCIICGSTEHLEAAHLNHDKRSPDYDNPANGALLCSSDHLLDHIEREGENGLTVPQNQWSIREIRKRVVR